jgi:hypothetical protein
MRTGLRCASSKAAGSVVSLLLLSFLNAHEMQSWLCLISSTLTGQHCMHATGSTLNQNCCIHFADPLPVEHMYYKRSKDPLKPDWITVRGTSKLEGYHAHLEGVVSGTGYAPESAGGILSLFNMQWSVKRGIQNKGDPDIGTAEPWMLETLAQLSGSLGLPANQFKHIKVPSSTAEKFGADFVPEEQDQLAAKAAEEEGQAAVKQELSEEEERLLAANTLDALRFLSILQYTALQRGKSPGAEQLIGHPVSSHF